MRSSIAGFALIAATMLGTAACARNPSINDDGNTTTSAGSSETESETDTDTSTMGDGDGDTTDESSNVSLSFYACAPDDDYFTLNECDPWFQDCPEGEKCVPYASTGDTWDANKCVPVTGSQMAGEACVYGGLIEATDDCDRDNYCFYVEEANGMLSGICTTFCGGSPDAPECDPGTSCMIANEGSITLCLPTCDPVLQDCAVGQACMWLGAGEFTCQLETDGAGATGEICGPGDSCESGSVCVLAQSDPGCLGPACCVEYCDLADLEFVCSNPESVCTSFFEPEEIPPGYENVGICVAPP